MSHYVKAEAVSGPEKEKTLRTLFESKAETARKLASFTMDQGSLDNKRFRRFVRPVPVSDVVCSCSSSMN